jgi:hypothetical protein
METHTAIAPITVGQNQVALIGGLPCSLTYFVADLARDLLARRDGACEVVPLNDLGEASAKLLAAANGPVSFLAEVPDAAVIAFVRDAAFPVVFVDQPFAAAAKDFMAARGIALLDTARTMARAQSGLDALARLPRTTTLRVKPGEPGAALVARLATALAVTDDHAAAMVAERNLDRPLTDALDEIFVHAPLPPHPAVDALLGSLAAFYNLDPDAPPRTLEVPAGALLEGTAPYLPATAAIELLGPARCLTFGPYFYLPKGRWKLRFFFLSGGNESTNSLGFDVTADQEIKFIQDYTLNSAGRFEFRCEFTVDDPFQPFEFRSHLRRGSIGGTLQPLSLTLERCDSSQEAR